MIKYYRRYLYSPATIQYVEVSPSQKYDKVGILRLVNVGTATGTEIIVNEMESYYLINVDYLREEITKEQFEALWALYS